MLSPASWVVPKPLVLSAPVTAATSRVGTPGARTTEAGKPTWRVGEAGT
ncbi:hypothetical protein ACLESD_50860 [Pyxidicoccus sp. 3LFB2]